MKVWILTYELNAYDQDGEYFSAVYAEKPTAQQLTEQGVETHHLRHVLNGGGHVDQSGDTSWFHLRHIDAK